MRPRGRWSNRACTPLPLRNLFFQPRSLAHSRGPGPSAGRTSSAAATACRLGPTSGLEGAWTNQPTKWDNGFLENLFNYDWELTASPAGAKQWTPKNPEAQGTVPTVLTIRRSGTRPIMLTSDLALKVDPIYGPIAKRFHEHPGQFAVAFAKAWYKLLHRDMGPCRATWARGCQSRSCGRPGSAGRSRTDREEDVAALKGKILGSGLPSRS